MRASVPVARPTRADRGAAAAARVPFLGAVGLLSLLTLSAGAEAARPSVRLREAGGSLLAGQSVTVTWDGLPADVRELELLLSLDGGRSYPIRLTESLEPAPGAFLWTVPRLPATAARLRLRYGRAGREEADGEPSAPFGIFVSPASLLARLERRGGECWVAEEAGPDPSGIQPGGAVFLASYGDRLVAVAEDDELGDPGPGPSLTADPARVVASHARLSARPVRTRKPEAPKRE